MFKKMYRMSPLSFNRLLAMILPWLDMNKKQSSNASKGRRSITAEIILHCTLHFLAGGSVHDIQVMAGMSRTSFYRCVHHGIDAINACPGLSIRFPLTISELANSAKDLSSISSHGIMNGCVAALDGWCCHIWVPSAN